MHLIDSICCLICRGDVNSGVNPNRYCNFQVLAMITRVREGFVKMSTLNHAYGHVVVIKAQKPMCRLVLLAVFLIPRKYYRGCDERASILFKMRHYRKIKQVSRRVLFK